MREAPVLPFLKREDPAEVADNAATQNFFRDVNERVMELNSSFNRRRALVDVICECGRPDCAERLAISPDAYELVRSDPTAFAMIAGHEQGQVEEVVERTAEYVIARNHGEAAKIASDSDPRRLLDQRENVATSSSST